MILPLRLIGGNPYLNYSSRLLEITDIPFIIISIIFLFIAYYKIKTKKYNFNDDEVNLNSKEKFNFQSYDVLMQPKKDYESFSTISRGIKPISIKSKKIIIGFLIFLFYYFLFTGKI